MKKQYQLVIFSAWDEKARDILFMVDFWKRVLIHHRSTVLQQMAYGHFLSGIYFFLTFFLVHDHGLAFILDLGLST